MFFRFDRGGSAHQPAAKQPPIDTDTTQHKDTPASDIRTDGYTWKQAYVKHFK